MKAVRPLGASWCSSLASIRPGSLLLPATRPSPPNDAWLTVAAWSATGLVPWQPSGACHFDMYYWCFSRCFINDDGGGDGWWMIDSWLLLFLSWGAATIPNKNVYVTYVHDNRKWFGDSYIQGIRNKKILTTFSRFSKFVRRFSETCHNWPVVGSESYEVSNGNLKFIFFNYFLARLAANWRWF